MLSKIPPGYKIVYESSGNAGSIIELIPEGEALAQWTEMLTVQVLRNDKGWTLSGFHRAMQELWADMCPCGSTTIIERGRERLRPVLIWSHACPLNKGTGKAENAWFKASIRGNYVVVVQKAFKFSPSDEAISFWISFLKEIRVNHQRRP
ncbi:hypothetical protein [Bosea sp. TAF32]|uniref:hypothetical protein n=1 Tax=Bosea sp. TAF32 TaxID=3237482 RepID=UPI003F91FE59